MTLKEYLEEMVKQEQEALEIAQKFNAPTEVIKSITSRKKSFEQQLKEAK